jgi:hypothetical protein
MYAPKLKTWLTPEDRAIMAITNRYTRIADEAHAEISGMVERAKAKFQEPLRLPPAHETWNLLRQMGIAQAPPTEHEAALAQMRAAQNAYNPMACYNSLGGFLQQRCWYHLNSAASVP